MKTNMKVVLFVAALAAALNTAGWYLTGDRTQPAEVKGAIDYVSYSPYAGDHDPKDHRPVTVEQLKRDMQVVASVADGVRTYSLVDGVDQLPAIASKQGLTVSLGAWVGDTPERDRFEMDTAVALTKQNRNIRSVLVGNEVLLRGERTPEELIAHIKEVKRQVRVPVSTGEIWYNWIKYPQLVKNVDFIAAHILPYWEGVPADKVLEYTWARVDQLKNAYPGKRIVIAEFGWPSQGYNRNAAEPTPLRVALGVGLGLVIGKPVGILLVAWLAVKLGLAELPRGVTWTHVVATGFLAGIGFTMALFVAWDVWQIARGVPREQRYPRSE